MFLSRCTLPSLTTTTTTTHPPPTGGVPPPRLARRRCGDRRKKIERAHLLTRNPLLRFECVFVRACGYQSFIVWRRGLLGSGEEALYTQVYFFPPSLSLSLPLVKNCRAGHTAHALFFVLSTAVTIVVSVGLSPFCFSSFLLFWEMARVCKLFRSVTGTRAFVWKERKKRLWRGGLFCHFWCDCEKRRG